MTLRYWVMLGYALLLGLGCRSDVTDPGAGAKHRPGSSGHDAAVTGDAGPGGDHADGGQGGSGTNHDAGGTKSMRDAAEDAGPVVPADICDRTTPPLGSCITGDLCQDSSDANGWSIIKSICVLQNDRLRPNQPCSTYNVSGRCYRDNGGHPSFTYYYGTRADSAREAAGCMDEGERFCPNLPGISDATYDGCTSTCAATKPDFSDVPECDDLIDCDQDCIQAVIGVNQACADCIREAVHWPQSGCGASECQCISPLFPEPTDPNCKTECGN